MKIVLQTLVLALGFVLIVDAPMPVQAQDLHPSRRLSPLRMARVNVGDAYVKIHYGAPYTRNRVVFGDMIPFGDVWRTGANE